MKRISENQKVTLTLGQLKRLVKESTENDADKLFDDEDENTAAKYKKVFAFVNRRRTLLIGANSKGGLAAFIDSEFNTVDEEDAAEIAGKLWGLKEGDSVKEYNRTNWYRVR